MHSFLFNVYYKSIVPIHENPGVNKVLRKYAAAGKIFFLIAAGYSEKN